MRTRFAFPIRSMNFLALTRQHSFFPDQPAKYSVSFPATDLPLEMAQMIPSQARKGVESRLGLITASSLLRPHLRDMTDDNSDMRELNLKLHDANTSIETVLRDMPGEIAVEMWARTNPRHTDYDPWGVSLVGLRFDASKAKVPTWEQITEQVVE